MSFGLSDELEALRDTAARFAAQELLPAARAAETSGWSAAVRDKLRGFDVGLLDLPESLGGVGAGSLAKVVVLEALAAGDAGGLPALDQPGPAVGALLACPDEALARELASAALSGSAQAALVVQDAEAPSALRVEWAPLAPLLRWVWVSRGDALALYEAPAALAPTPALAFHASGGVSCSLSGARARAEFVLEPGRGAELRGRARLWGAAVALGVAQSALDATLAYTTERVVFGKPVAHHQGNAFELAARATELHGARLLLRDAAAAFDRAEPHAGYWATQAWLVVIDTAIATTDLGIQLLGGHGFVLDHLAEKRFREVRMLGLFAGGRDAADADVAALALVLPDPLA